MIGEASNEGIKNSLWITKGAFQFPCKSQFFPMNGLAGVVNKNFPMSGKAANGEFFYSLRLLSHEWGKIVTRTGIKMYLEWRMEKFSRPHFLKWQDWAIPFYTFSQMFEKYSFANYGQKQSFFKNPVFPKVKNLLNIKRIQIYMNS